MPEIDRSRPAGNRTASTSELLGYPDPTGNELIGDQINWLGAYLNATPEVRRRCDRMLGRGDLDEPVADAYAIVRAGCDSGLTDVGDLAEYFVTAVHQRARAPRQPGDALPMRYVPGPESFIARAFTSVARMPDVTSAVVLALPFAGTGRRRAIAHAASELARAAANFEFDADDVGAASERLLALLGVVS